MYIEHLHTSASRPFAGSAASVNLVLNEILEAVAEEFDVTIEDMMVSCRRHSVWMPRMAAMYFARMLTPMSLITLGEIFGGRSHSTVLRACRRCRSMIEQDAGWAHRIERLQASFLSGKALVRAA